MASKGPRPPYPPSDFDQRPIEPERRSQTLYRISKRDPQQAAFFSRNGLFRFDYPNSPFGVCYFGTTPRAAILETYGARFVKKAPLFASDLRSSWLYEFAAVPMDLCPFLGKSLTPMGATSQILSGSYPMARKWSEAIMGHPGNFDGILYTGRLCQEDCVALFDRNANLAAIQPAKQTLLWDLPELWNEIQTHKAPIRNDP